MLWFLILPLYCSASIPQIQEIVVESASDEIRANLVPNFSFEDVKDGVPIGWQWNQRNTDASLFVDKEHSHTGDRSVKLQNSTPYGAHVYGTLWTDPPIPVKPRTRYTLSFYARSDSPGAAWVGGGQGWSVRVGIQPTGGVWRRFSTEFTTAEDETDFVLRINTDSPTPGFWVDDMKLEEGAPATLCEPPQNHEGMVLATGEWPRAMPDGPWRGVFDVHTPETQSVRLQAEISQGEYSSKQNVDTVLPQGFSRIVIKGEAIEPEDVPCVLSLAIADPANPDSAMAEAAVQLRFLSASNAQKRLQALSEEAEQLKLMVEQVRQLGMDPAYPLVGVTVVSDFIQYIQEDLQHGEMERAFDQISQMESGLQSAREQLQSAISGKTGLPEVPRYVTSPITIQGPSFIADAHFPVSGKTERRPIFFTGHGHFSQVLSDLEKFPGYGINIIQIEFGPTSIFPEEGKVSDEVIRTYLKDFNRAAESGVSVCLLISPHYMPEWMMEKYPGMKIRKQGFLRYCLHVPEGQEFLKRYLQHVIPQIKDHPALHSICLANEPINPVPPECEYAQAEWHSWLRERHGNVEALNQLWNSQYESFQDIPIPDGLERSSPGYEFVLFNQEWFAGWHAMLSDTIREIAPDLPIHTKAMTWNFLSDQDQRYGVDAELFARFSQINGNDSVNMYSHGSGEWSQGWQLNNMGHDLQRSVGDMPVFNTENHIIRDRETRPIPPGHVRTALWQAAIHGQSATTIWVWARTYDPKSDFAGSIMHRPACAEAVGRTGLDLLRLAEEVQALQKLPPQMGLLYSTTSMVYDGGEYTTCLGRLYTALSFTGLKIGFVTERQLISGEGHRPPVLLIPNIEHLPDKAFEALTSYPGRVVLVGGDSLLGWNEYNHPRSEKFEGERIEFHQSTETRNLWETLLDKLPSWGLESPIRVTDADGSPVWGVEWLVAEHEGRTVINLIQHGKQPVDVVLSRSGEPFLGTDLFDGERVAGKLTLKPLDPRIALGWEAER